MKLAMVNTPPDARGEQLRLMASPGVSWAQFGDQVLFYADDTEAEDLAKRAGQGARRLQEYSAPAKTEPMYIVVQNGRLFQLTGRTSDSAAWVPTRLFRAPPSHRLRCGADRRRPRAEAE
jgi:hypothetical protein